MAGDITQTARMVLRAWLELTQRTTRFTEAHVSVASGFPVETVHEALVELQVSGVLAPDPEGGYVLRELPPPATCPRCEGRRAVLTATLSARGVPLVGALACPTCQGGGDHAAWLLGAFEAERG